MNIRFRNGILDDHTEEVPSNQGWDKIEKLGITDKDGARVIDTYRLAQVHPTDPLQRVTGPVHEFHQVPDLVINPGETARIIKLPQKFWT